MFGTERFWVLYRPLLQARRGIWRRSLTGLQTHPFQRMLTTQLVISRRMTQLMALPSRYADYHCMRVFRAGQFSCDFCQRGGLLHWDFSI